jgi:hypothetical protein
MNIRSLELLEWITITSVIRIVRDKTRTMSHRLYCVSWLSKETVETILLSSALMLGANRQTLSPQRLPEFFAETFVAKLRYVNARANRHSNSIAM